MSRREMSRGKWAGEMSRGNEPGPSISPVDPDSVVPAKANRPPANHKRPAPAGKSAAARRQSLTLIALALGLAACSAEPRELTEVEKACQAGPGIACAQAKALEKRRADHIKAAREAGLIN